MSQNNNNIDYSKKVLEVDNLKQHFVISKRRGGTIKAVNGVSFDVYKREVFGLVGESGCGKTTTGRSIIKLYDATDGSVKFNDQVITQGFQTNIFNIRRARRTAFNNILENSLFRKEKNRINKEYDKEVKLVKSEIQKIKDENQELINELNRPSLNLKADLAELKRNYDNDISVLKFNFKNEVYDIKSDLTKEANYNLKEANKYSKIKLDKKVSSIKFSPLSKEDMASQIALSREIYSEELVENLQIRDNAIANISNKLTKEEQNSLIEKSKSTLEKAMQDLTSKYQKDISDVTNKHNIDPELSIKIKTVRDSKNILLSEAKAKITVAKDVKKQALVELKEDKKANPDKYLVNKEEIKKIREELKTYVTEQRNEIKEAKRITSLTEEKSITLERKKNIAELKEKANEQIQALVAKNSGLEKDSKEFNSNLDEIKAIKVTLKADIKNLKDDKLTYKKVMKSMQMIFQDPISSLDPRMTVHDIIAEGLVIQGVKDKAYIDQRVKESLELVGLTEAHSSRYIHEFSGGQRQRIGIARALIVDPEFIIADEPISALDVSIQAQVINLLKDLREQLGLTILFVAHDLSVVKYFSDRIAVMYQGKIVELTSSEELFANPLHPYTKSLLSAIPLPDPISEATRQRVEYDPSLHNYSEDLPEMHEIKPGHFIYANAAEMKQYQAELKKGDN